MNTFLCCNFLCAAGQEKFRRTSTKLQREYKNKTKAKTTKVKEIKQNKTKKETPERIGRMQRRAGNL